MSDLKSEDQTIENSNLVEDIEEELEDSDDNLDDVKEEVVKLSTRYLKRDILG